MILRSIFVGVSVLLKTIQTNRLRDSGIIRETIKFFILANGREAGVSELRAWSGEQRASGRGEALGGAHALPPTFQNLRDFWKAAYVLLDLSVYEAGESHEMGF